jgi:hypothetical protein
MRTRVEFRSRRFAEPDGQGNRFNPEIQGAKLAAFLSEQFAALGYAGTVIEEDWGWMVELAAAPFPLWLGCSSLEEGAGWQVFIEPSKPVIRKLFRKIDTQDQVEKVAGELEHVLRTAGEATDLVWQD